MLRTPFVDANAKQTVVMILQKSAQKSLIFDRKWTKLLKNEEAGQFPEIRTDRSSDLLREMRPGTVLLTICRRDD
jgi:hypothetical protein